ncbi:MAG: hypothetical protein JKY26_06720 [Pseudomonas sp.]|nr:hypothetical protein [Pseudomonas sp.]
MLVDGQPWFCMVDLCRVLGYANSRDAVRKHCREKGVARRDTSSTSGVAERDATSRARRFQVMTFIDEGNLYRLIIKSRKEGAQRFEAWVCDEVLPAIRQHGRYEDRGSQMGSMVLEAIGVSELTAIKGVIQDKAKQVPKEKRLSFLQAMHRRLHTRFNVSRTELIPHKDFAEACNFVAAYALEGEWLASEPARFMDGEGLYRVYVMSVHFDALYDIFKKYDMYNSLRALGSRVGSEMIDHFKDGHAQSFLLRKHYGQAMDDFQREHRLNQYANGGAIHA